MVDRDSMCGGKVYGTDQGYLHAMAFSMNIDFVELDVEWNRCVTWDPYDEGTSFARRAIDPKTLRTKFVHIQMRGADNQSNEWHWLVANKPKSEWHQMKNGVFIR